MRIDEILRYPNDPQAASPAVDGLPNFFFETRNGAGRMCDEPRLLTLAVPVT